MGFLGDVVDFFEDAVDFVVDFVDDAVDFVVDTFFPGYTDDVPDIQNLAARNHGILLNRTGTVEPIPLIYGRRKVGGVKVLKTVAGDSNEKLYVVLVVCEGEIDSFESIFFDDIASTDSKFSGKFTINEHLGTDSQAADAMLLAAGIGWQASDTLSGIAYLACEFIYDTSVYRREPQITCIVKGRKILDTRTSTTAWSDNPGVCTYDYLTNSRYGKGLAAAKLNTASFEAAATAYDALVTPFSGASTQKKLLCNAVIDTGRTLMVNVRELLSGQMGQLPWYDGQFYLLTEDAGSSTFSLTETNVLAGFSIEGPSKQDRYNRVVASFTDPDTNWQIGEAEYPEKDAAEYITLLAADNGFANEREVSLPTITDVYRARHIAQVFLNRSRYTIRVSLTASLQALAVTPGDIVDVTLTGPDWTAKPFRVLGVSHNPGATIGLSLIEHQDVIYPWTTATQAPVSPSTNLPDPNVVLAPTNLVLASGTAQLLSQDDGTQVPRILATLTLPLDIFVTNIEFQIKLSSDPTSAYSGAGGQGLITQRYFANVADGVAYDVRARAINTIGAASAWIEVTSHTVIGKSALPADVTSFLIAGDDFTWVGPESEFDFDGYELRFHYGDNDSYGDANPLHTGRLLASPFTMAVRPSGPVTFMIKAFDRSGNESANAAVIKTALGDAAVANVVQTFDQKALAWPGTLTDGTVDGSNNLLADIASSNLMWDADPTKAMWTVDSATMWAVTIYDDMVYETTVTVADAGLGSIMTLANTIVGGAIEIDYRPESPAAMWVADTEPMWSADGNVMWTAAPAYETWPGSITVANDIYNFRVSTGQGTVQGTVTELTVTVDLPDLNDFLGDVSISAGGTRLSLTKTFDTIQVVNLTLQDDAGTAETLRIIDKNAVTGPLVKAFDASDVATTALIDAHVQGY